MRRITSALFLDFDNLFSRLLEADRAAAGAFIGHPDLLIDRLSDLDAHHGLSRDVLVRRAYLNPAGTIPHPSGDPASERVPFSRYRAPLTKAGYEVIDCPTLTTGKKNAADIRMVIDVLDALTGPVRYDEVIIGSSDADFTPLLVKLRANDRRTMILTTGAIAAPYGAMADRTIGEAELVRMLSPALTLVQTAATTTRPPAERPTSAATQATKITKTATTAGPAKTTSSATASKAASTPTVATTTKVTKTAKATKTATAASAAKAATAATAAKLAPVADLATPSPAKLQSATDRAIATVAKVLAGSETPVSLSAVGLAVHKKVGAEVVRQTKWFGHSTLTGFLQERHKHLGVDTLRVWDPARHEPPAAVSG